MLTLLQAPWPFRRGVICGEPGKMLILMLAAVAAMVRAQPLCRCDCLMGWDVSRVGRGWSCWNQGLFSIVEIKCGTPVPGTPLKPRAGCGTKAVDTPKTQVLCVQSATCPTFHPNLAQKLLRLAACKLGSMLCMGSWLAVSLTATMRLCLNVGPWFSGPEFWIISRVRQTVHCCEFYGQPGLHS